MKTQLACLILALFGTVSFVFAAELVFHRQETSGTYEQTWVQTSFADFRAGVFEDSGANLYVTASGEIRSIYTFDYNRDGANDVLFVSGHNIYDAPPTYLYMNNGRGLDAKFRWELLNDGSRAGLVSDLNKDGFPDVVLCGTTNAMATRVPLDSIIYHGSDKGFFPTAATRLPTFYAYSVARADFNGDGWDDLVFTQSGSRPTLIFWNGPNGFDDDRRTELSIQASHVTTADMNGDKRIDLVAVTSAGVDVYLGDGRSLEREPVVRLEIPGATRALPVDLNADGKPEIVVAHGAPAASSYIYWNDGGNFSRRPRTELPTTRAAGVAAGDLNSDGYPDLAFANSSLEDTRQGEINSVVYWGGRNGFDANRRLELPTRWASQCGIGDINGDGFPDLVFANRTSIRSQDTESFVYWGGREGIDVRNRQELPTRGAADLCIEDANGDGLTDLVFFNGVGGINGYGHLRIYWNDKRGSFSTERKLEIPAYDSFSAVCADFDNDGNLDWAVPNSYEYAVQGEGVDQGSFVYWGDASGQWSERRRTTLKTRTASGVVSADLNRDGYLDLVIPQYADPERRQLIFWGGAGGFRDDRTTALHMPNPRGVTLADFNKDGWLDIVIADIDSPEIPIFWGGPEGYSDARKAGLPNGASVTANAADLNNDGWLDLLVCNFWDGPQRNENTNSFIYWGSADGFRADRRTLLPTVGADQATIADFNRDGLLDIAIGNYSTGARDRTWFSYVYWNSPQGFSPVQRSDLYTDAGSGNLALDFNNDGWLDLVMACHKQANGDHSTYSYLFWGGPNGFQDWNKIALPTNGAHETTFMDAGNIYTRRFELGYQSSVYDAGISRRLAHITWKAEEKLGAKLRFEIRGSDSREDLERATWRPHTADMPAARYWQYRALFISSDGSNYPVLDEVAISFQ